MEVLVTGGAGFIGSHLVDELLTIGNKVKVLDNLSSGNLKNLEQHKGDPSFQFLKGDIRSEEDVKKAIQEVDAVFHGAAITSVPASMKDPELTKEVNVNGTISLLERSLTEEVKRFIFASTCAVYGETEDLPISEDSPLKPTSPYAESKIAGEEKCREYGEREGLKTVILRYFNVYGPRQRGGRYAGVISKFLKRLEEDKPPIIYGDGNQTRDFVYVEDAVNATLLILQRKGAPSQTFNVGSGEAVSVNELYETLSNILGKPEIKPIYKDSRPGDIRHSWADLTKAEKELGYTPKVSLEEGLEKLIKKRGVF